MLLVETIAELSDTGCDLIEVHFFLATVWCGRQNHVGSAQK